MSAADELLRPRVTLREAQQGRAQELLSGKLPPPPPTVVDKAVEAVTGDARATEQTNALPELVNSAVFAGEDPETVLKVTPLIATTFDDEELGRIVSEMLPNIGLVFNQDGQGNAIPFLVNNRTGAASVINRPGLSPADGVQLAATGAAFTPAGATTKAGVKGALHVAGKTAATEAGIQAAQAVSGGEFDPIDVAAASAGGGLFESLGQQVAKRFPALADASRDFEVTDEVRNAVREEAVTIGFEPSELTDQVVDGLVARVRQQVTPSEALAIQGEREFNIPLTAGQRSLDDAALSFEDRARSGALGNRAQSTIRDFETGEQLPAVRQAVEGVRGQVSPTPVTQQQAGGLVREGIQQAERAADDAVAAAYADVGEASLDSDGVQRLLRATRNAVRAIDNDRGLRGTAGLLSAIKAQERAQRLPGVRPADLKRLDLFRRRINTAIGAAENASDKRQMVRMKRAFDDFLDEAVMKSLFEGDEQALGALKEARGLFAEYARKFRSNPTKTRSGRTVQDAEGNFIEKIVEANPTDEQIVNAVFGAANFSNTSGAKMAQRFKTILGEDSEGWSAIRQAAFDRLVKFNTVNGQQIVSGSQSQAALLKAWGTNRSLMQELFTDQEFGTFRRLFAQIKRTQPDLVRSRENPSGTAQAIAKTVQDALTKAAALFTGDFSFVLTSNGVEGIRNATRAASAVRPFSEIVSPNPLIPAAGATLGKDAVN